VHVVLVHNIGHHDLYFTRGGDPLGNGVLSLSRPSGSGLAEAGRALQAHLAAPHETIWLEGRGVRVPPLRLAGDPDGIVAPLLAAALDRAESLAEGGRLTLLLVSSGPASARNTPVGFGPMLARIAEARWGAAGRIGATAIPVHLPGDAFELDPADLHVRVQGPIVDIAAAEALEGADWSRRLRVLLSASTGTAAMLTGLVAALGRWHPQILAVPNARQEPEVRDGRLVGHIVKARLAPLREVGDRVALGAGQLDEAGRLAVQAMTSWKEDFVRARPVRADAGGDDESQFWFRKGRKEVLATLVFHGPGGELSVVRGVNMEVSLPTGTLCAERNAIGTALALHPALRRADLQAVAVLGLNPGLENLGPCGACQEWLRKVAEVNPRFQVLVFDSPRMARTSVLPVG